MDNPETPNPNPSPREQPAQLTRPAERSGLLAPSPRVTAALAAAMLGVGVAVGAAIGPAPSSSLALGQRLPLLLPSLLAAAGVGGHSSATAVPPPAIAAQATPRAGRARHHGRAAATVQPASENSPSPSGSTPTSPTPRAKKPTGTSKTQASITHVWLIELSGTTLESALAASTGAPYINTQAAPAGTALGGWSAIDASAFASDAALLASKPPQLVDTIVQPPCSEGAAGAQCAAGTPSALSAADTFLAASIPAITSTAAYRTNGLIVVTFGSIAAGSATGLPGASTDATLTSQPPAGALLISPFVTAGASSSTPFTPASPTQSLERLLHP